jgi:hypothetical protein
VEEGQWAIARLPPDAPMPEWAESAVFSCGTRTRDELSIVCPESAVPEGVRREGGWAMLKLAGPFPFTEVGILSAFLAPLAAAGVSVFAISTFDTDYVLVKAAALDRARKALASAAGRGRARREGHSDDPEK